jgi:hypothetical protein
VHATLIALDRLVEQLNLISAAYAVETVQRALTALECRMAERLSINAVYAAETTHALTAKE